VTLDRTAPGLDITDRIEETAELWLFSTRKVTNARGCF
jgi:hypothetical protein